MEDRIDRFDSPVAGIDEDNANQENRTIFVEALNDGGESEASALLGLFFYSILMFTVPIGGFVATKHYLEQNFHLGFMYNLLVPIIIAVVLVNLIIMLYVFRAFREDKKDRAHSVRPIEERKKLE